MQAFKSIILQAIHVAKDPCTNQHNQSSHPHGQVQFKERFKVHQWCQKTINSMSTLHDKTQEERFNKDV